MQLSLAADSVHDSTVVAHPAPRARPVRVLLACDHIAFDGHLHGSGRVMLEMLRGFDPSRVQVHGCVLRDPGDLAVRLRAEGVPLTVLGTGRFDPRPIWALARLARETRADVLHVWDFGAATFGRLAGLLARVPVVVHIHSHHSRFQRRGFPGYVRAAYRLLAPLTARAVAISASIREFGLAQMGFREQQMVTIHNPAGRGAMRPVAPDEVERLRVEYGFARDDVVIGAVTRLYPVKGINFLIEAMPAVLRAHPEARLLVVGEGPLHAGLEARARELGVAHRITFAGFRADAESHYRLFTLTAMPSLEEGMPMAAIESVVAGVPLVASREGGIVEVVTDGRTGVLVPVGDPSALADAIVRVLDDPELLARLRHGCEQERARFSPDRFTAELEALYREVAALPARANG